MAELNVLHDQEDGLTMSQLMSLIRGQHSEIEKLKVQSELQQASMLSIVKRNEDLQKYLENIVKDNKVQKDCMETMITENKYQQQCTDTIMVKLDEVLLHQSGQKTETISGKDRSRKCHRHSVGSAPHSSLLDLESLSVSSDKAESVIEKKTNIDQLAAVISQYDRREAPKPEPFLLSSGSSFSKFISRFETFCSSKYAPGTEEHWTGELGSYLRGDLLKMYKTYGGGEVDYSIMKAKLKDYCTESEDLVSATKQDKFLYATILPEEKLYMYALRLEQLFIQAYPGKNPADSHELRARFMHSIPETDVHELEKEFYLMKAIAGTPSMAWSSLVTLLRHRHEYENKSKSMQKNSESNPKPKSAVWYSSNDLSVKSGKSNPFLGQTGPRRFFDKSKNPERGNFSNLQLPSVTGYQRSRSNSLGVCYWCSKPGHQYRECRRC